MLNIPSLKASQSSLLSSSSRAGPLGAPLPTGPLFLTPKEACACTASSPKRTRHPYTCLPCTCLWVSFLSKPRADCPPSDTRCQFHSSQKPWDQVPGEKLHGLEYFFGNKRASGLPVTEGSDRHADEQAMSQVFLMERCAWLPKRHCPGSAV